MEKQEIKIRVRVMGPIRRPEDYRTGSFKRRETEIPGIAFNTGLGLKTARQEILDIRFSPDHYTQDEAAAWTWRNYNILRIKEAEYNDEPFPKDLQI